MRASVASAGFATHFTASFSVTRMRSAARPANGFVTKSKWSAERQFVDGEARRAQHGEETIRHADAGGGDDAQRSALLFGGERTQATAAQPAPQAAARSPSTRPHRVARRGNAATAGTSPLHTIASTRSRRGSAARAADRPAAASRCRGRGSAAAQFPCRAPAASAAVHRRRPGRRIRDARRAAVGAAAARLRATATGTASARAISSGSSPTSRALSSGRTMRGRAAGAAVAARDDARRQPRAASARTSSIVSGVLPVPPTYRLPMTTTGTSSRVCRSTPSAYSARRARYPR